MKLASIITATALIISGPLFAQTGLTKTSTGDKPSDVYDRGAVDLGGGNPSHVQQQTNQQKSKFADTLKAAENEERAEQIKRSLYKERIKALSDLEVYVARVDLYFQIFELMNYPFSSEFKQHINRHKVAKSLSQISNETNAVHTNFSIDDTKELNGKPITFLSSPDLENPSNGKLIMNSKLFYQQVKSLKPWSLVATVFHEALRLQNIEGSDSYPYSTEFALALKDAYENRNFYLVMKKSIFDGCPRPLKDYEEMAYHFYSNTFLSDVSPWGFATTKQPDAEFIKNVASSIHSCGGRIRYFDR
jgi:hypothetical protein